MKSSWKTARPKGHVHAIGTHVPSDLAVLLDIGDVEREVAHAMAERAPQILSDGITAVDGLVVRRKVHSIWSVCSRYFVQDSSIPVSGPVVAHLADDDSCVAGFGRFARCADGFAWHVFCALFHGSLHSGSSHKRTLADVFYCREDGPPSTFNGLHLDEASIFARARCLESRKVRQALSRSLTPHREL